MNGRLVPCVAAGRLHPDVDRRWSCVEVPSVRSEVPLDWARPAEGDRKLMCFTVGNPHEGTTVLLGVSYAQVVEVTEQLKVVRVPGLDEERCLLGVAEWQGRVLPVLDVQRCLGLKSGSTGDESLFGIVRGVAQMGLIAVPIREARTVKLPIANASLRVSGQELGANLKGSFVFEGGKLLVPDLDLVLV